VKVDWSKLTAGEGLLSHCWKKNTRLKCGSC